MFVQSRLHSDACLIRQWYSISSTKFCPKSLALRMASARLSETLENPQHSTWSRLKIKKKTHITHHKSLINLDETTRCCWQCYFFTYCGKTMNCDCVNKGHSHFIFKTYTVFIFSLLGHFVSLFAMSAAASHKLNSYNANGICFFRRKLTVVHWFYPRHHYGCEMWYSKWHVTSIETTNHHSLRVTILSRVRIANLLELHKLRTILLNWIRK
jgi:hypothetical protein